MSAQEWVNKNPAISISAVCVLLVPAVMFAMRQLHVGHGGQTVAQAFFSDDDGKTYFRDSAANLPPFDHNGATAYGVVVLRCPGGKPFVAYLRQYDAKAIAQIQSWVSQSKLPNPNPYDMDAPPAMEAKKPGESTWISNTDLKQYMRVTTPKCPDGSDGPFRTVTPEDPDSGATN